MKDKKPFGKKLRVLTASFLAAVGIGGAGTLVLENLPKDPQTDTPYIFSDTNNPGNSVNPAPSAIIWQSTLGFQSAPVLEQELLGAAGTGDSWRVRALTDTGMDLESNGAGAKALDIAVDKDHRDVMRDLTDAGVTAGGQSGALVDAAADGKSETVQFLMQFAEGANAQKDAALLAATLNGDLFTMRVLLENGADAKAGDSAALVQAAMFGNSDAVRLLLRHGANPNAQSGTPMQAAIARGDTGMQAAIKAAQADPAGRMGYSATIKISPPRGP